MKRRQTARRTKLKARRKAQAGPRQTIPYGKGWSTLCKTIRAQQGNTCRRCGATGTGYAVDHTLPRRLWPSSEAANTPANLALLCPVCHGHKTAIIEPALYGGDPSFIHFHLKLLARSGPVPSSTHIGDALARAREHLEMTP